MQVITQKTWGDQATLNRQFEQILPQLRDSLHYALRRLNNSDQEEAMQETTVQAFVAFVRLVRLGRTERIFPSALARFAVLRFRSGRRVTGKIDPCLDRSTNAQSGLGVGTRRPRSEPGDWAVALIEDRRTPIPEQVSFRIDFPEWLDRLPSQFRQIAVSLAEGLSPAQIATQMELSRARISQIRRDLQRLWEEFQGDSDPVRKVEG